MASRPRGRLGHGRAVGRLEAARRAAEALLVAKYGPKDDSPPGPRLDPVEVEEPGRSPLARREKPQGPITSPAEDDVSLDALYADPELTDEDRAYIIQGAARAARIFREMTTPAPEAGRKAALAQVEALSATYRANRLKQGG